MVGDLELAEPAAAVGPGVEEPDLAVLREARRRRDRRCRGRSPSRVENGAVLATPAYESGAPVGRAQDLERHTLRPELDRGLAPLAVRVGRPQPHLVERVGVVIALGGEARRAVPPKVPTKCVCAPWWRITVHDEPGGRQRAVLRVGGRPAQRDRVCRRGRSIRPRGCRSRASGGLLNTWTSTRRPSRCGRPGPPRSRSRGRCRRSCRCGSARRRCRVGRRRRRPSRR